MSLLRSLAFYGVFYLGTECLRKFKTAFLLRNFMSDLINEVLCLLGDPLADDEFASGAFHEGQFVLFKGVDIVEKYQSMRSKLEYAVANRHCEPPALVLDTDFFERIDKRRTSLGLTDKMLYDRGVRVVDHGHEEGGGDDEGGLGDAGDQRCGRGEGTSADCVRGVRSFYEARDRSKVCKRAVGM